MIRKMTPLMIVFALSCSSANVRTEPAVDTIVVAPTTTDAELLRLEDRREFDRNVIERWVTSADPERQVRGAIAIARIGTAAFEDDNGDGWKDENEAAAGTSILLTLHTSPHPQVRRAAAFAIGEIGELRGVEALFDLADDETPEVATSAVEAISKLVPGVPFDRYQVLLGPDKSRATRLTAIRYLFRFASEPATATATMLLDSQDKDQRRAAAYSLNRHAIAKVRTRIEALLRDSDALTRSYAVRALGRISHRNSLEAYLFAIEDPHAWVRTNALRSLARLLDDEVFAQETWTRMAKATMVLVSDPDPGTRAMAIETLGRIAPHDPESEARLREIAKSGTPWNRELATLWLARSFGLDDLEPPRDRWTRIRVTEGVTNRDEGAAVRQNLFSDVDGSVRAAVIGSLPDPPLESDADLIRAALADKDPIVRGTAYGYLETLFPNEAVALLRKGERDSQSDSINDARVSAVDSLATLEFEGKEEWLTTLLADADPMIRRAAADHLATVTGRRPQYTPLPIDRPLAEYQQISDWAAKAHVAVVSMTRGEFRFALRTNEAPMTAWNFSKLAASGYFDGTTFMRVVPNFVIQGGDPRNDMSGGPGYAIRDEINLLKYDRGAVGMALSGPDTGGSQFFVTHSPQPHLDGGYTIFGHVISGMGGVVDQVERGDVVNRVQVIEADWLEEDIDEVALMTLPTVIGSTTPDQLMTIVPEYPERREDYEPDADIVSYMASVIQPQDHIKVFLGTWCDDSQREVPRFLKILDALSTYGVEIPVEYVAVNRMKNEPAELIGPGGVDKVATFIYYRDETERGRIVERPDGPLEDHLLQVIAGQR